MKDKESGRNLDQAGIMSLYPTRHGLSTLVTENGDFVSRNRRFCCRFWRLCLPKRQLCIRKQMIVLPKTHTKLLFRETKSPFLATSVDRPLVRQFVVHKLLFTRRGGPGYVHYRSVRYAKCKFAALPKTYS